MTNEPRHFRGNLIPAGAIGVPEAVQEADARLRAAAAAADQATADRLEADRADRAGAQFDSEAAVSAVEAGKRAPQPTAAAKKAEFARAVQQEAAARAIARREMLALGRAVVEHREEWREAQAPAAVDQGQKILATIDDVERELGLLGQGLGILGTLSRDTVDVDHGLSFKAPTVGARERRPIDKQLAELRNTIRAALPAPPPRELQERNRRWRQMAAGGVHVP